MKDTFEKSDEIRNADENIVAACKNIYKETAYFYESVAHKMNSQAFGFKILYGPPCVNAQYLFMGFQPGGAERDAKLGESQGERKTEPFFFRSPARENWQTIQILASAGYRNRQSDGAEPRSE